MKKKAQKASQAALKVLEKLAEEEKQRDAERLKRIEEAAREREKLEKLRAATEAQLAKLREQAARAREEAEMEAVQQASNSTGKSPEPNTGEAKLTSDFVKQHAARAKERSKEMKRLEEEQAKKNADLQKLAAEEIKRTILLEKEKKKDQQQQQKLQHDIAEQMAKLGEVKLRPVDPSAMASHFCFSFLTTVAGKRTKAAGCLI